MCPKRVSIEMFPMNCAAHNLVPARPAGAAFERAGHAGRIADTNFSVKLFRDSIPRKTRIISHASRRNRRSRLSRAHRRKMQREYHRWYSHRLGFDLGVVVYGHWGPPLIGFPTSAGDEWELQNQGMIASLADLINGGRGKFFS